MGVNPTAALAYSGHEKLNNCAVPSIMAQTASCHDKPKGYASKHCGATAGLSTSLAEDS